MVLELRRFIPLRTPNSAIEQPPRIRLSGEKLVRNSRSMLQIPLWKILRLEEIMGKAHKAKRQFLKS
jgi:hypothetical protein